MRKEEVAQEVLQTLRHIHDLSYLESQQLGARLFPQPSTAGLSRAERLRRLMLEGIEELCPAIAPAEDARLWRGYYVLTSRYVEGREVSAIMEELAISERQFYREHRKALGALVDVIWEKLNWVERRSAGGPQVGATEPTEAQELLRGEIMRASSQRQPVCFQELLQGVLQAVRPLSQERQVVISCDLPRDLAPLHTNRTILRQVFIQILSRYMVQLGAREIRLRLRQTGKQVTVEMVGLTAEGGAGRCDPEFDVPRALVELVGGSWLGSDLGESRVVSTFLLPTTQARVLLAVEDNPGAVQLIRRYLAQSNYDVVSADNGPEALRLARELHPDVIALDVMLPGQDGWEILETLKGDAATRDIPVLILSVLDETGLAAALGAGAYLKKPYTQAELLATVEALGPGGPASSTLRTPRP